MTQPASPVSGANTPIPVTSRRAGATRAPFRAGLLGMARPLLAGVRRRALIRAMAEVGRNIADDAQKAFERNVVAHSGPGDAGWFVSPAGGGESRHMDAEEFARFREALAARGEVLVTLVYEGTSAREASATLARYVGGRLHGTAPDTPALVTATPRGLRKEFWDAGAPLAAVQA